jgi:deoxyribonuclease I
MRLLSYGMTNLLLAAGLVLGLGFPKLSSADPPQWPFSSFESAKRVARDVIYSDQRITFYCGCVFVPTETRSGGKIDATECGYTPRKNKARGERLEWEHVVPAFYFGRTRTCWKEGHAECVRKDGKPYKGRNCCGKVDEEFQRIEADVHNLTPAVGELNGDRSNLPYGIVAGDATEYGKCDFKIGGKPRTAEPRGQVKGDAARIWLYMSETYAIKLSDSQRKMFEEWSKADPIDDWERLRNDRIEAAQGNRNPNVK